MKSNTGSISIVLVLIAVSSLVSMISTLKIDEIVHGDLYRYGLQFSSQWAVPYWTLTSIVFGMGWFNIIASVAFEFYVLIYGRRGALKLEISREPQAQPTKGEVPEIETKPTEKVEEYKEQATGPAEKVEKKPDAPTEEVEEKKEQESKTAEESKMETKETTPATETEHETPEKSEEEPILVGVPEEEPQTATEETPQQVGSLV